MKGKPRLLCYKVETHILTRTNSLRSFFMLEMLSFKYLTLDILLIGIAVMVIIFIYHSGD